MLNTLSNYRPSDPGVWQGRKDSVAPERFFQQVKVLDVRNESLTSTQSTTALLGFCSDEGIRRNEGRIGAKSGPIKLREQLAKLPAHCQQQLIDVGNISCEEDLEFAQAEFAKLVSYCHQQGCKTIAFGGGHEIAWGHYLGLRSHYPRLGIINFDAHFDLRPLKDDQFGTSGTPFWQIALDCQKEGKPFSYCCVGIQELTNTKSLFERADSLFCNYLFAEQVHQTSLNSQLAFLEEFIRQQEAIYLSICLDVFAECFAPGVSAPQSFGLTPWQVQPLLKYILQTGKVVSIDVAELSPPLDKELKTTRLGASLVAGLLDFN